MPHRRRPGRLLAAAATAGLLALAGAGCSGPSAPAGPSPSHPAAGASSPPGPSPRYYLALGDSLAQGVQPATRPLPAGVRLGQSVETRQGYADDLEAHYRPAFPRGLTLADLGCPGETTASMLTGAGSPCRYAAGSQLAAARAFLRAHAGQVALVTVDIGANDVDGCAPGGTVSVTCVTRGIGAVESDLPRVLAALRSSAGGGTRIVGMTLYDPFVAEYLTGTAGQGAARRSVTAAALLNQLITADDAKYGVRTADVQGAFSTGDFAAATLPGVGTVPVSVARVCTWTWVCAAAPLGPKIQANAAGYRVIAAAFERAAGPLPAG